MKLSIIVPAYNEEDTIAAVLDALAVVPLGDWEREIIVVDDGSRDAIAAVVAGRTDTQIIRHPINRGKGAAIQTGIAHAHGDAVIIQDADLEYDPADIPRLLDAFAHSGVDAVFGSRNLSPDSPAGGDTRPTRRRGYPHYVLGVAALTGFINLLFRARLTDAYTGYKLLRTSVIKNIGIASTGFEFEAEITCLLLRHGYTISEVPIHYRPRSFAEGKKIRFRDGITGLRTIWKIWLRKKKKVMVFGVFDGLHEGHHAFLRDARTHGDELIAVVARDEIVKKLKNKTPRHSERERRATVARAGAPARAILGDRISGTYAVITEHQPDIICLGYDQDALGEDLKKRMARREIPKIQFVRLKPHKGE